MVAAKGYESLMAKICRDAKVGDFVYKPYSPNKAGKVVKVQEGDHQCDPLLTIKWLDGTTTEDLIEWRVSDFEALLEDHKKKVRTHQATLKKLEEL